MNILCEGIFIKYKLFLYFHYSARPLLFHTKVVAEDWHSTGSQVSL